VKARRFRITDGSSPQVVLDALWAVNFDHPPRPFLRQSRLAVCKARGSHECARLAVRVPLAGSRRFGCTMPDTPCPLRATATECSPAFPEPVDELQPFPYRARNFLAFVADRCIAYSDGDDIIGTAAFAFVNDCWPAVDALAPRNYRKTHKEKWRSKWRESCREQLATAIATDWRHR
jgi:hypothetical protein